MLSFSLKWMLAGVAGVALGCVALLYASPVASGIAYTVTTVLLLTAVVGGIVLQKEARAFWVGFAVFGWGYVALVSFEALEAPMGEAPTVAALDGLFDAVGARLLLDHSAEEQAARDRVAKAQASAESVRSAVRASVRNGSPRGLSTETKDELSVSLSRLSMAKGRYKDAQGKRRRAEIELRRDFQSVGHALFAILLALIGGVIGRFVYATRD